ncbi:MAG: YbdK family carboxylate-amine ligase [Rhabdochlamydiaceae bacterium]|nr:YbdK family carboxylate-amine ligase [Rhabdochlamydiaceae bacterium]
MSLKFLGSENPTIGVELEIQIIDPATLNLTPKAKLFLEKSSPEDLHRIKTELYQSMLETDTEVAKTVSECRKFLQSRMGRLQKTANELNLKLAISGTHPFQQWTNLLITPSDHYEKLHHKYQWLIRRNNIYGLHVHIGVKSGDLALAISNSLVQYLPHLLALSANSPFWQGTDTGMQSCRTNIIDSFLFSGTPHFFHSWAEFEHYYKTLHDLEAINSVKDIYWHIRPNIQFGTLEFRICDAMSNLDEIMAVVALIQCLVAFTSDHIENNPNTRLWNKEFQWIAPKNQWDAARDGLEALIVRPDGQKQKIATTLLQLVQQLTPTAKKLDCLKELEYVRHIVSNGNNAQRQRELFQETRSLQLLVNSSIKDFETIAKQP